MATQLLPVAPPSDSLEQDYKAARLNGDAESLYSLMPRAQGTAIAPRIYAAAQETEQRTAPIQSVIDKVQKNGGVATPEGRMAKTSI